MFRQKEKSTNVKNMTEGNPMRILLFFALPLMAGNVFQQLYTVTDTAIVGQAIGVEALAALSALGWLDWLYLGLIQGITQGFSILTAQRFGANDGKGLRKSVGASAVLCGAAAAVLLVAAQGSAEMAVRFLGLPEEIIPIALRYLRVFLCGIPIVMVYNLLSCILRALGDSRTPLYAMLIASFVNIGLDLLFVVSFGWGVAGAAAATVIGQTVSAVYCFIKVRTIDILRLKKQDFVLNRSMSARLGSLAAPMALQNLIVAVGGLILQTAVNQYGVAFIAGYGATIKLYGLLEGAGIAYGYAMVTYTGQNIGAGKTGRVSQGLRAGICIGLVTSILIALVMITQGRLILRLFINLSESTGPEALATGYRLLVVMSVFLPILYVLHVVRSCIQGLGNTFIPMLSGLAEFVMRTGAAFLLPPFFGADGILFAEVIAWFGADLVLIPGYFITMRKLSK